ncbi:MAG: PspC domain-containing protein [Bacteroidota bacterium]
MEENNFPNIFDEKYEAVPEPPANRLERSASDVIIAGVCSGLAKYFNTDPSIIRIIAILSFLLGVWTLAAYLIFAYLLPPEKIIRQLTEEEISFQRKVNLRTVISGLMIFTGMYLGLSSLGLLVSIPVFIIYNSLLVSLTAIGFGIFLYGKSHEENIIVEKMPVEKFYRVKNGRIFLGVCGGLAKYFNSTDVTTIRIILVITTLLTLGLMLTGYFLFAALTNYEEE